MLTRELMIDAGWLIVLVLLLPLAIAGTAIAFGALLAHRLYVWTLARMRTGFAG